MVLTAKTRKRISNALVASWVGVSVAVMGQGLDTASYMTDGSVDVNKVEQAVEAGTIRAGNAPALTRKLVNQAPGLEEEITKVMRKNFPDQAEDILIKISVNSNN